MGQMEESGHSERDAAVEPTELVARLRARLAEHEAAATGRFRRPARWSRVAARRRLTRRHRVELAVGAGAAVLAVGAAAIAMHGGRGSVAGLSAGSTPPRPTAAAPAPTPGAANRDILRLVPVSWRASCRAATGNGTGTGTGNGSEPSGQPRTVLTCAPAAGISVEVQQLAPAATAGALARLVPATAGPSELPECARGTDGLRTWSAAARPDVALGRVACFRSRHQAQLVWSIEGAGLVMHAARADGDVQRLFAWWRATTF